MITISIISFIAGAITGYLVLRNNPKYKAYLDATTNKLEDKLKKK